MESYIFCCRTCRAAGVAYHRALELEGYSSLGRFLGRTLRVFSAVSCQLSTHRNGIKLTGTRPFYTSHLFLASSAPTRFTLQPCQVATKNDFSGTIRKICFDKLCFYCFVELRALKPPTSRNSNLFVPLGHLSPLCRSHGVAASLLTVAVKFPAADGCPPSSGGCDGAMPFSLRR